MEGPKLGKLISGDANRDAVHVAVAPVIAAQDLNPGTHIGFVQDDNMYVGTCDKSIGIVDPFLAHGIKKGSKFWMFLYPQTTTSLSHYWEHPAFKDENVDCIANIKQEAYDKGYAEAWEKADDISGGCLGC